MLVSFKPSPGANDLGYVPGKENSHAYAKEVQGKFRRDFQGSEILVEPCSAPRPEKVPPGCFCADVYFPKNKGEQPEKFESEDGRFLRYLQNTETEYQQPGGHYAPYMRDGSDDRPRMAVAEGESVIGYWHLVYLNSALIGAEEMESQVAAREHRT